MRSYLVSAVLLLLIAASPSTAAVVSHTFSGLAFEVPSLVSGVVPPEVAAFFASKNLSGTWFAASFSFDDAVLDSDPILESAEYRNAIIESDFAFGPLQHEATTYCNDAFLDCSIFVDNDLPFFGSLLDSYTIRARNHSVVGVPQVLIPGTSVLVDAFIVNGSFILEASETDSEAAPLLVTDVAIDQDVEGIFGAGGVDIVITYFGTGPSGAYSFGYRTKDRFFVPEPEGALASGLVGIVVLGLRRRAVERSSAHASA